MLGEGGGCLHCLVADTMYSGNFFGNFNMISGGYSDGEGGLSGGANAAKLLSGGSYMYVV